MARRSSRHVCQECGALAAKWSGRCDSCGAWNSIIEESEPIAPPGAVASALGRRFEFDTLDGPAKPTPRSVVGIPEFDRVCGGGLVPGSVLLVGGDPGIGKSTLLLQVAAALARLGRTLRLPCRGKRRVDQIRMRARRLALSESPVRLAAATDVRDILATLGSEDPVQVVVVDSVQTMFVDSLESAPGTVAQVARGGAVLHPFRQDDRGGRRAGRPRDQGGADRRSAPCSSTWSTRSCTWKGNAATSSVSCGQSRTGSVRRTRSACSR